MSTVTEQTGTAHERQTELKTVKTMYVYKLLNETVYMYKLSTCLCREKIVHFDSTVTILKEFTTQDFLSLPASSFYTSEPQMFSQVDFIYIITFPP